MPACWLDLFIVAAYASLLLELVLIPVPSVASAVQLAKSSRAAQKGPVPVSALLRLYLPVVVNVAVFLLPLLSALTGLLSASATAVSPDARETLAGAILVILGRLLTVTSALDMRASARQSLARGTLDTPLRTRGLFRYSRNPGLVGMYLFAAGLLLLKPSIWFALGLVHYVWHMHSRVLMEERHLRSVFDTAYLNYAARTRRYV